MRQLLAGAAVAVGVTLLSAGTASAWWAEGSSYFSGSSGVVQVAAEAGEQNDLVARNHLGTNSLTGVVAPPPADGVLLHDPVNPVTPAPEGRGAGCTKRGEHTLFCRGRGFMSVPTDVSYLELDLGDGNDRVRIPIASAPLFLLGGTGSGDDTVVSSQLDGASIQLGDGDDRITLRGSQGGFLPIDSVGGGPGDDVLDLVNGGDDSPTCGDGVDVLRADPGETNADCETVVEFP